MSENKDIQQDFITYPRTFESYKWYKPLLVLILFIIFYLTFIFLETVVVGLLAGTQSLKLIDGGYDTLNVGIAGFATFLSLVLAIPSLYLTSKIVHDRPFSSYASSRGGWNWKIYFKSLAVSFVIYFVYLFIMFLTGQLTSGVNQFTLLWFIIFLIVIPIQTIAEEYIFRGFLLQTLGAWFKIPAVAIIIQAVLFALLHAYNLNGVVLIFVSGIMFGFITWRTNGIEASSALHSVNNLFSFYMVGFGLSKISSNVSISDMVISIVVTVVSTLLVYYIGKKYNWFGDE